MLRQELFSCRSAEKTKKKETMSFWKTLGQASLSSFGTSVASGLGSGFINALFNSPQKQLKNSKRLMAEQARINKDLFDYQYQKELPSVRVEQLKQAGLNPALMYSGSGVSGLNAQMGHSSPASAPRLDLMTNSNPLAAAQVENIETNSESQKEDIKLKRLQQIEQRIDNLLKEKELDHWNETYQAELDKLYAERDNLVSSSALSQSKTNLNKLEYEFNSMVKDIRIANEKDKQQMDYLRRVYMEQFNENMPSSGVQSLVGDIVHGLMGTDELNDGLLGNLKKKIRSALERDDITTSEANEVEKFVNESLKNLPTSKRGKRMATL